MSIMENDYFYARPVRPSSPEWYRPERYDYCETASENNGAVKRSFFTLFAGKKRSK